MQIQSKISLLLIVLMGAFCCLTMILGVWLGKHVKTLKGYVLANRRFGVGVLSMTFLATYVGVSRLWDFPGAFAEHGVVVLWEHLGLIVALIGLAVFVAPALVYFRNAITAGDIAGELYGNTARILLGMTGTLYCLLFGAIFLIAMKKIGNHFLGLPPQPFMLLAGGVLLLFMIRGGVYSVIWTDVIQFIALVVTVAFVTNELVIKWGGVEALFSKALEKHPTHFAWMNHSSWPKHFFKGLLNAIGVLLLTPPFVQRILMSGSARKAKRMTFAATGFYAMMLFLLVLVGVSGLLLYPHLNGVSLGSTLLVNLFSPAAVSLIGLALLAICISTADSFLHAGGVVFVHDVVKPLLKSRRIAFNELKYLRLASFGLGIGAILVVIFIPIQVNTIYHLSSYLLLPISLTFIPLVAGIVGFKTDQRSFFIAFLASAVLLVPSHLLSFISSQVKVYVLIVNALVFFTSHYVRNGGFVIVNRKNGSEKRWKLSLANMLTWLGMYFPTPGNIMKYAELKVAKNEENALLFGSFITISYMLPYVFNPSNNHQHLSVLMNLKALGVLLCVGLMFKSIWPKKIQKHYFPIYWHITLLYCLPFATTLIFLLGGHSINWQVEIAVAIFMLIVLVDWVSFFILESLGVVAAIACFYALMGNWPTLYNFETKYALFSTCAVTTVVGLLFARRKEIFHSIRFKTVTTLARFVGHEANTLSNYTLAPSQSIYQELVSHADEMVREVVTEKYQSSDGGQTMTKVSVNARQEGYFITKETYNAILSNAKIIERGTHFMVDTSRQLSSIIHQYSDSLNNPKVLSMRSLIKRALESYPGGLEQRRRIRLKVEKDFIIKAPVEAMIFVIHNIIRNAYLHGGKDDIEVEIALKEGKELHIRDNGIGVPPENFNKIFDMFFTTGRPQVNTGIGLGFAQLVVEWMNGKIRCESSQLGSTFTNFVIIFPSGNGDVEDKMKQLKSKEASIDFAEKLMREKIHVEAIQKLTGLNSRELEDIANVMSSDHF